ncbi:MAG: valine--tRNA ligase [Gemmatimonadetes bacterium]|nr:valine--tRNA ligase [Gemmatimonadota bacterium]
MSTTLPPQYDPGSIEAPLYREWEERGYFRADPDRVQNGEREPYVIVIPPPNVTAVLHMGHGLNNTIQDVLIRWRRMQGREALYLPGTDHAGIATQNVVERLIGAEGKTRDDLGREAFVERVWSFVNETGSTILEQLRAIGCSCDWTRTRFTLDPGLSRAVREVFVRLYEKDLIYRGEYIINWCPRCLTALSDEEAEGEETTGWLYHLRYPLAAPVTGTALPALADGRAYVVVATTRPETMLGDTAVAVHPDDERYHGLAGARVALPLTGREIPIIADASVDPAFGSGAVKITPAHDPNDFAMARRHGLAGIDIMTPDAHMNENAPAAFRGLDRFEARDDVVAALEALDLIERVETHTYSIPRCYRCDTIVEPRVSLQWFVRMQPLAEPALAASRDGRVRFTPERHRGVYENWLENIRDWCISRQLWWGHRIPVWYCQADGCGAMTVARDDPHRCAKCGGAELVQDNDVLDTWFSSWLWPFSTLGWPERTPDVAVFYPGHALVTAQEILFFWVARMIMAGLEFMGDIPFRDVYLNGTVRDLQRRKMSKSLGNGIDPLEVVRLFGADALRYTVIDAQGLGTDILMDPENLEETFATGRNLANKVWNAGRFILMNVAGEPVAPPTDGAIRLELADRWILSRAAAAVDEVTRQLEAFRFHEAAEAIYHFFRGELADWYLELVKPRLRDDAVAASRTAARAVLVSVFDVTLRLLHPVMPFITEALWRRLPAPAGVERGDSLMVAAWPETGGRRDPEAEAQMDALMELIGAVRQLRSEYDAPPAAMIRIHVSNPSAALTAALAAEGRAMHRLARVEHIENDGHGAAHAGAHAVLRDGSELFVPLSGLIDVDRERDRLARELDRVVGLLSAAEARLSNQDFLKRAPADVIAREREKADSFRDQRERLSSRLASLG